MSSHVSSPLQNPRRPFAGIHTPIATPFQEDGTVDEMALRRNIARWMQTPLTGLVVLGSNGEAPQLDDFEADDVVTIAREGVPRDRTFIVGTGRESTRATIQAGKRAAEGGADAVLVRTPSFFKAQMTAEVLERHYRDVADASPVPVLLYNVAMFTGVTLPVDSVARLSEHPNIVGMKESGSDIGYIADCVTRTPGGLHDAGRLGHHVLPCALRWLRRRRAGPGVSFPGRSGPHAGQRPCRGIWTRPETCSAG